MDNIANKGFKINSKDGVRNTIRNFFLDSLTAKHYNAVMLPMMVPSRDSYAWIIIKDPDILKNADPIAPIMPVNAAIALKRYTRKGKGKSKIAVLMRPCEIRATIELAKLNQVNLEDVTLFSYDCPGALPMQDFIADPKEKTSVFDKILQDQNWTSNAVKPICQSCDNFSLPATDVHFAFHAENIYLIPNSKKGETFCESLKLDPKVNLTDWMNNITQINAKKAKIREKDFTVVKSMVEGFDNLQETFANCIGCHNCGSSCPICYCRQCYFDTSVSEPNSDVIMMRAQDRGGISLPLDRLMFHIGRMAHMSLSCVSCGLCSDACPVDIPVSKIFSYMAAKTQKTFEYKAGANIGDALPMKEYKIDELGELGKLVKSAEVQESSSE